MEVHGMVVRGNFETEIIRMWIDPGSSHEGCGYDREYSKDSG